MSVNGDLPTPRTLNEEVGGGLGNAGIGLLHFHSLSASNLRSVDRWDDVSGRRSVQGRVIEREREGESESERDITFYQMVRNFPNKNRGCCFFRLKFSCPGNVHFWDAVAEIKLSGDGFVGSGIFDLCGK